MPSTHDNVHSLIGAYVMGAVPEDEIPAIRAHILTCDECFEEAESYSISMAALADSVEPIDPGAGFADSILDAALGREKTGAASPARRVWWSRPAFFKVGFAVALVGLIAVSASFMRTLSIQRDYRQVVEALVADPGTLKLEGAGGASGLIASSNGGSVFVALELGEAPMDREYQLWLMRDGTPVPSETFDADDDIVIVRTEESVEDYEGAAVTVEPEGGSEQPTTEPVLVTT